MNYLTPNADRLAVALAASPMHCDECDWTFGCFQGQAPCRKKAPAAEPEGSGK